MSVITLIAALEITSIIISKKNKIGLQQQWNLNDLLYQYNNGHKYHQEPMSREAQNVANNAL